MDSPKNPQPLKALSAASLIQILKAGEASAPSDESAEAKENRMLAAHELSMIFELNESRAFQWFVDTFLSKPHRSAEGELKSAFTPVADLDKARAKYLALREIRAAVLEREIAHRQLIAPGDEEIERLRERLLLL